MPYPSLTPIDQENIAYFLYVELKSYFESMEVPFSAERSDDESGYYLSCRIPELNQFLVPNKIPLSVKINDEIVSVDITLERGHGTEDYFVPHLDEKNTNKLIQAANHQICYLFNEHLGYKRADMYWEVYNNEIRLYQSNRSVSKLEVNEVVQLCQAIRELLVGPNQTANKVALINFPGTFEMVGPTFSVPWHMKCTALSLKDVYEYSQRRRQINEAETVDENNYSMSDLDYLVPTPPATEFDGYQGPTSIFHTKNRLRLFLEESSESSENSHHDIDTGTPHPWQSLSQ